MAHSILMVDLDGTLLRDGQTTIPKVVAGVLTPIVAGGRLVINSARHADGVRNALRRDFPFVPTIALNGAALYDRDWLGPSQTRTFGRPAVDRVVDTSVTHDVALSLFTAEGWWVTKLDAAVAHEEAATGMVPDLLPRTRPENVLKMTAMSAETVLDSLASDLAGVAGVSLTRSNVGYCEISPRGTSKASLVPALLDRLGFVREEVNVHFLGDSYNDIECAMLSDSVYTFDTSPLELRRLARKVFRVRTDLELAHALEQILGAWTE